MCTVTYLPLQVSGLSTGFVLTSNRDEKTVRPSALEPAIYRLFGHVLIFPKDPQGKGSWIAVSESGTVVCLLNGAFFKHLPMVSYKHSRGLVTLDYFKYFGINDFLSNYDFSGIEPFTLVVVEDNGLSEIRWDGIVAKRTDFDANMPHIWSSVTLYTPEIIAKREQWFQDWLKNGNDPSTIVDFHMFGGEGEIANKILMNRDDFLRTVSISSIRNSNSAIEFFYKDLKNGEQYLISTPIEKVHE